MKTFKQLLLYLFLLFLLFSCNYGDEGVFAAVLREGKATPSKFPAGITVKNFAQTATTVYVSYGKISKYSAVNGVNWDSLSLPETAGQSDAIAASDTALFLIARNASNSEKELSSKLYVYEKRGQATVAQWYTISLPKTPVNWTEYQVMNVIFFLNNKLFLLVQDTTSVTNKDNVSATRILEIADWENATASVTELKFADTSKRTPQIHSACYAQGKYWFAARGSIYSSNGVTLTQEQISINTETQKGPFLAVYVDGQDKIFVSAIEKVYRYDGTQWEVSNTVSNSAFSAFTFLPDSDPASNQLFVATSIYSDAKKSYAQKGLYRILGNAITKLESPDVYDSLDNIAISSLITLSDNSKIFIGTIGESVWELDVATDRLKKW